MSDFQAQASIQGRDFETTVAFSLKAKGWTIDSEKTRIDGVEIDIIATDPSGQQWWIECKGSHRGATPGMVRGDTAKKAVAVAYHLHHNPTIDKRPYMVITSHMPHEGTVADKMLQRAIHAGAVAACIDLSGIWAEQAAA